MPFLMGIADWNQPLLLDYAAYCCQLIISALPVHLSLNIPRALVSGLKDRSIHEIGLSNPTMMGGLSTRGGLLIVLDKLLILLGELLIL